MSNKWVWVKGGAVLVVLVFIAPFIAPIIEDIQVASARLWMLVMMVVYWGGLLIAGMIAAFTGLVILLYPVYWAGRGLLRFLNTRRI